MGHWKIISFELESIVVELTTRVEWGKDPCQPHGLMDIGVLYWISRDLLNY